MRGKRNEQFDDDQNGGNSDRYPNIYTKRRVYASKDIHWIIRCFYVVFFVFPDPNNYNSNIRNVVAVLIDIYVLVFLFYCLSVDFFNIYRVFSKVSITMVISTIISDSTSILIRLTLIKKRKSIIKMFCRTRLLQKLLGGSAGKLGHIFTKYFGYMILASSIPIIYTIDTAKRIQVPVFRRNHQKDTFFGWYSDEFWLSAMSVLLVDILIQQQHYFMQGFCIMLCCHIFRAMSCLIESLRKNLFAKNHESLAHAYRYFTKYSAKVLSCMDQMEDALSYLVTLLYGFMIWNIFQVITFLAQHDLGKMRITLIFTDLLVLILSILSFLILSVRASDVHTSAMLLHKTIFQTVATMASPGDQEGNLMMKMSENFVSKATVTGSNLFTLKREFILRIASAVFTYGIILVQIGK